MKALSGTRSATSQLQGCSPVYGWFQPPGWEGFNLTKHQPGQLCCHGDGTMVHLSLSHWGRWLLAAGTACHVSLAGRFTDGDPGEGN